MAIIKCKMCGGDLNVEENSQIAVCEYCGTQQTVPKQDNEKKLTLFARANRLRFACEFDKAAGVYESIVAEFPEEAEAYWGLVLCKYGIEYVDDPATGKKVPTCHRSSFDSVLEDANFELVMEYADVVTRKIYREEAKAIEELRRGIIEVSSREEPYDIFICYKETDENGQRTLDSVLAQDLYDALTEKGYRVFFSRITLEDKLGQEYEPYIFAALNSARVMLAVGTDYEYYNAPWVKNEWSRYLQLIAAGQKKSLIPCYKNIDAYDMPKEFAKLQAQDLGKVGAIQDLLRGIAKIIQAPVQQPITAANASTGALTKRGYFFLEDEDFRSADEYFEKALDENPEDSKAYVGKVLAGLHMKDVGEIDNRFVKLYGDKNFERAIRFAVEDDKQQLQNIKENADRKWLIKCLTVCLKKICSNKEADVIKERIAELAAQATVTSYDEIVRICNDAYARRVDRAYFNATRVELSKMQSYIIKVLSDCENHSASSIKENILFSIRGIPAEYFETSLKEMIRAGSIVKALPAGTYCVVGATEKRQRKEHEEIFTRAEKMMTDAVNSDNYQALFSAADLFASLGDFRNSASKSVECMQLGEKCKAAAEAQARAEARAKAEAERRSQISALEAEKRQIEAELPSIKGLFSGGKRRAMENRLMEIANNIKELQRQTEFADR